MCEMTEVLEFPDKWECVTCGHEWPRAAAAEVAAGPRVVKDAHGNVLADGDCVILIKDLKLGGSSVLKGGSNPNPFAWWTATMKFPAKWTTLPLA